MPLNASDVPAGVRAWPHEGGVGVAVNKADIEAHDPIVWLPEARAIADIYRELIDGSPIGIGAGMGGLLPEKLLWTQIEAYCRVTRTKLSRWALQSLHLVDSVRLNKEFERLKRDAQTKP